VSTPHNRATNAGIYQCAFHVGIFAGGLILGAVQKTFPNYNDQYAVFVSLAGTAVIVFVVHAFSFRHRFRNKSTNVTDGEAGSQGHDVARVQNDDGTVEYRAFNNKDLKSENAVVQDLALSGGRDGKTTFDKEFWKGNFWNPVKMLWHPIFGPLGPAIFVTGES
jgi:MFS family permease